MKRGLIERSQGAPIPRVWSADTWWSRMRGLLARPALAQDGSEALLIRPCASVHTIGMRYRLDLVFLAKGNLVLDWRENLRPSRAAACPGAIAVIEFHGGALARLQPRKGEHWQWRAATAEPPHEQGAPS